MYDNPSRAAVGRSSEVAGEAPRPVGSIAATIGDIGAQLSGLENLAQRFNNELSRLVNPRPSAVGERDIEKRMAIGNSVESQLQDVSRRLQELSESLSRQVDILSSAL